MKSQIDLIEQDFRALQSEFKKKNTQIKESFDNALKWIESKKDQQLHSQPRELLEPLQLIFDSKITKSYPAAANCLQKIAQAFTITEELLILGIVGMLREASSEQLDEMTQLRILQLLLAFLDPKTIVLSKELVNSVLQCCFQMFETKQNAVRSTIQATLKTLLTLITEKFTADFRTVSVSQLDSPSKWKEVSEKNVVYQVIYDLLQNIAFTMILFEQANLSSHKKSVALKAYSIWNLKPSQNARCVLLDLLNLILSQTKGLMVSFPEILALFELQIVPTLDTMMQTKQVSSLIGLRQMKCAILIIQNVGKGVTLLNHILVEADTVAQKAKDGTLLIVPGWRNHIGFECLQIAIANAQLTKILSQMSFQNSQAPILLQILECYLRAAKAIEMNQDKLGLTQSQELAYQYIGTQKIAKLIDAQVIDSELASPSIQQISRIIIESVCTFSDNFVHVFQAIGVKLGTQAGSSNRDQNFNESDTKSEAQCKLLLQISWKPLLETIQRLIRTNIDEASLQMLLRAYQSCIGACGSANCYEARDAFLTSLCGLCITSPQPASMVTGSLKKNVNVMDLQLTERNILISKTVLNIAHCLCHILDVKSWFVILETMQKVEDIVKRKNGQQDTPQQQFGQLQLNFQELRQVVFQRMNDFNIIERSKNKGTAHHTRISSVVKQSAKPPIIVIQPIADDASIEIQILLDSFNSLFTSSLLFDEQSLAELVCALAQLTVNKLQDANSSQNYVSDFGPRRLVETSLVNICRIEIFWKIIVAHFEMLAQSKDPQIRQLVIEALHLLILEYFQLKKAEQTQALEDVTDSPIEDPSDTNSDEQWINDQWQYTILLPLAEQLKLPVAQDKILVLKCIEKIIQLCGQQIKNEGWRIIIVSVSKSLEIEAEQVISCGFRCLKLIVSNYISKLSQPNFRTVLDAIHLFASNKGDNINSNLSAISMFQNVADFIARQIKSEAYSFKNTWLVLFERIKSLGLDHRAEVRRANIHTLENIVMTHGATFSSETDQDDGVWPFLYEKVVLGMLQQSIEMFSKSSKAQNSNGQSCQTPQFSTQKKINFEEASVSKALKQYDEHWEDTCTTLAETACRSFKKFVLASQDEHKCSVFWDMLVTLLADLISSDFSSMELCKTVFKSLSDLAPICAAVISQESINSLLKATRQKVQLEQQTCSDDKNAVLRLLKCVPILVESLQKMSDQTELFVRNTENLYGLLAQLTKCSSLHEGLFAFGQPNKLLSEEKVVFDFIESLCVPTIAYYEFLFEFLVYNKEDQRSEAFIRRSLSIFFNCLLKGKCCTPNSHDQTNELLPNMMPQLFSKLCEIVDLRYDSEIAKVLIFSAKGQTTLFYTAGLYLILITSFLLNADQFRARTSAHQQMQNFQRLGDQKRTPTISTSSDIGVGETGTVLLSTQQNVLTQYPLLSADRNEFTEDMLFSGLELPIMAAEEIQADVYKLAATRDFVWEITKNKLLQALLFDSSRLKASHFGQEVFKSSMDLEIQVINFIVNCLLPNSVDHQPMVEYEQQLIQIIDSGCQQLSSSNTSEVLSKYCLNNLFELCKISSWQTAHDQIRVKIANMAIPILVNRCRQSLKKFVTDEQKAGAVPLPRSRVTEVCFTLRKLQELESVDKSHLLQLLPTFAELVISNEQQLKEVLRIIFLDISEAINKTVPQNRCSSGGANF